VGGVGVLMKSVFDFNAALVDEVWRNKGMMVCYPFNLWNPNWERNPRGTSRPVHAFLFTNLSPGFGPERHNFSKGLGNPGLGNRNGVRVMVFPFFLEIVGDRVARSDGYTFPDCLRMRVKVGGSGRRVFPGFRVSSLECCEGVVGVGFFFPSKVRCPL